MKEQTNDVVMLKEISAALEKLIDVSIAAIEQSKEMLAAVDSLIEQNDILIVELSDRRKDEDNERDDGYVTMMNGQRVHLK